MTTKKDVLEFFCKNGGCRGMHICDSKTTCNTRRELDRLITDLVGGCPDKGLTSLEEDGTYSRANFIICDEVESWKREVLDNKGGV